MGDKVGRREIVLERYAVGLEEHGRGDGEKWPCVSEMGRTWGWIVQDRKQSTKSGYCKVPRLGDYKNDSRTIHSESPGRGTEKVFILIK